jgi:hypothetical protein
LKRTWSFAWTVIGVALLVSHGSASAGVQVTTCSADVDTSGLELPPIEEGGAMFMTFFACPPNVTADELVIELYESGTFSLAACAVPPSLEGSDCSHPGAESVSFTFEPVGPFECVPNLPGDANKSSVLLLGPGADTAQPIVREIWKNNGNVVANFITILACPDGPISVDQTSWGRVKSMYR